MLRSTETVRKFTDDDSPSKRRELEYLSSDLGFLTKKQFKVLLLRGRGFSQVEIARELRMSRAGVSMLEVRARRQLAKANRTLQVFELTRVQHRTTIDVGTRLQQIPMLVLQDADRFQIHLRMNMVEILRLVKKHRSKCIKDGRTTEKLCFSFNERGRLAIL